MEKTEIDLQIEKAKSEIKALQEKLNKAKLVDRIYKLISALVTLGLIGCTFWWFRSYFFTCLSIAFVFMFADVILTLILGVKKFTPRQVKSQIDEATTKLEELENMKFECEKIDLEFEQRKAQMQNNDSTAG